MSKIVIDDVEYELEAVAIALRYAAHDAGGDLKIWLMVCALAVELADQLTRSV